MGRKLTTEEFIERAREIHGDRYSYELVDYERVVVPVKIVCPDHGVFEQRPTNHLYQGRGCAICGKSKTKISITTEQFIAKAKEVHGYRYSYELVDYVNNTTKVKIVCPDHGVFEQVSVSHLKGHGCSICSYYMLSKSKVLTTEQFIAKAKEVHGNKYSYELVDYVGCRDKVNIICPDHGVFEQRPNNHLSGYGCPKCAQIISKQEIEFTDYIKSIYDGTVITNTRGVIPPYELDVYLPDEKIAFEYNGTYWHNEGVTKPIGYHDMKTNRCKELSIELYHIWEDDWMNNREECKERVKWLKTV